MKFLAVSVLSVLATLAVLWVWDELDRRGA